MGLFPSIQNLISLGERSSSRLNVEIQNSPNIARPKRYRRLESMSPFWDKGSLQSTSIHAASFKIRYTDIRVVPSCFAMATMLWSW